MTKTIEVKNLSKQDIKKMGIKAIWVESDDSTTQLFYNQETQECWNPEELHSTTEQELK